MLVWSALLLESRHASEQRVWEKDVALKNIARMMVTADTSHDPMSWLKAWA